MQCQTAPHFRQVHCELRRLLRSPAPQREGHRDGPNREGPGAVDRSQLQALHTVRALGGAQHQHCPHDAHPLRHRPFGPQAAKHPGEDARRPEERLPLRLRTLHADQAQL